MLCRCGCGQEAGVYPRTQRGNRKGDPMPYLRGHWNHRRRMDALPPPNPDGLCMCGCGRTTEVARQTDLKRGDVVGQHKRYWRLHGARATWRTEIGRDDYAVEARGFRTRCWIWLGKDTNQWGHGRVTISGVRLGAHRAMYEQMVGPIPDGLELDHLCKQPPCIRPDHLEPVTHAENIRRSPLAKLTREQATFIRESPEGPKALAERFGISTQTIHDIRSGKSWVAD